MRTRGYSILALAAGLAACGSSAPVGAADPQRVEKPAPEPLHESASVNRYCIGQMPKKLRQVMLALPEGEVRLSPEARQQRVDQPVMFVAVRGLGREADFLVDAGEWWIRSFGSPDPAKTAYWVSAPFECRRIGYEHVRAATGDGDCDCAQGSRHSRVYRLTGEGALVDATLDVLPPDPVIKPYWRRYFDQYFGSDLFLDEYKLQYVSVMRWTMEFDPQEPLPESDPHAFSGGVGHFGFLVWNGDNFTLESRVPRRLWPCKPVFPGNPPCSGSDDSPIDPFAIDEALKPTAKEADHEN